MSKRDSNQSADLSPHTSSVYASGEPVDVVKRDIADVKGRTRAVDETVTPSSIRTKEQDAEKLTRAADKIERKIEGGS